MDWKNRIELAGQKGRFNSSDKEAASYWSDCAVGESLGGFETEPAALKAITDHPNVEKLYELGAHFAKCVDDNHIQAAKKTLEKIIDAVNEPNSDPLPAGVPIGWGHGLPAGR